MAVYLDTEYRHRNGEVEPVSFREHPGEGIRFDTADLQYPTDEAYRPGGKAMVIRDETTLFHKLRNPRLETAVEVTVRTAGGIIGRRRKITLVGDEINQANIAAHVPQRGGRVRESRLVFRG